jgi:hypothetical protein
MVGGRVAGGRGPEDVPRGGEVHVGADGPGPVARPGVVPAEGIRDHLDALLDEPINGRPLFDVGVEIHEPQVGVRRHVVDDLGAGQAVILAGGDVAVGPERAGRHLRGKLRAEEALVPHEADVQDADFRRPGRSVGGDIGPAVGPRPGDALARHLKLDRPEGEPEIFQKGIGGQRLEGFERHDGLK